jgi:hypothetical protein
MKTLPPCDHDECPPTHCAHEAPAGGAKAGAANHGPSKVVAAVPTGSGCGMCAHWKQTTRFNRPPFGMCMWRPEKRPAWFSTENSTMLFETDGKNCEAFTPNDSYQPTPGNGAAKQGEHPNEK